MTVIDEIALWSAEPMARNYMHEIRLFSAEGTLAATDTAKEHPRPSNDLPTPTWMCEALYFCCPALTTYVLSSVATVPAISGVAYEIIVH